MSAAEKPIRHDFNFSMGDESKRKLDALMARCGQDNLNLLVARGLALVAWAEDQSDDGRIVGSIFYGADEPDFRPLEERPELVRPRPRPQLVPVAVAVVQPVAAPEPEPEPVPDPVPEPEVATAPEPAPELAAEPPAAAALKPAAKAPERTPAEFNGQLKKPKPFRVPERKDDKSDYPAGYAKSPIRSLSELQLDARQRNLPAPIDYEGQPLPAGLNQSHAATLAENMQLGATHFRLMRDLHLVAFKFVATKGWSTFEAHRYRWVRDGWINDGLDPIYSIKAAQDYLLNNDAPAPEPEPEQDHSF